jgi:hypothetical protein
MMGNINQTLCYFCIIVLSVNLSCQKGSCMGSQEVNEVAILLTIVQ